jgi:hypothetical protein
VYDFTPPGAGTVRLTVTWQDEVGSSGSGDICDASQTFDIPVLAPTAPTITGAFSRGGHALDSFFSLRLKGRRPQDPATITVTLRARRGTTKPPQPKGPALARFTYRPRGDGHFEGSGASRQLKRTLGADETGSGVEIHPYVNIPFGRPLTFAFSLEVTQNGKTLGGMRSGATCRRIQFTGHSAVKCRAVGLKLRP